MSSNRQIFRPHSRRNDQLFQEQERPSHTIEVKLQLKKKIDDTIYRNLAKDLDNDGMTITIADQGKRIISVTGIPPENGYNENSILAVVKQQDKNAKVVSTKTL